MAQNTFQNLQVLHQAQLQVKKELGQKYDGTVTPFITIIVQVMKAKECNEFEALKHIKENLSIYNQPNAPRMFSAALMEVTEEKNFSELKK